MKDRKYSFFESYHKALTRVSDERYGRVVRAMSDFVFLSKEPNFSDDADWVVWELVKPILEKGLGLSQIRAAVGKAGGLNGKGVSRNIGNEHAAKSKANQKQNKSGIGKGEGIGEGIGDDNKKVAVFSATLQQRKEAFCTSLIPYYVQYGRDTVQKFLDYWTEPNRSHTKMRFELQKTWETQFNSSNNRSTAEQRANEVESLVERLLSEDGGDE